MPRLEEKDIYLMWMLLNWQRIQGKSAIGFDDLTALGSSMLLTSVILNNLLKTFPIKFKNLELVRGKYAFDGFCGTEFKANTKFIEEKPDAPVSKGLKKLYSGKFTMEDVHWAVFKNKCGMEFIQFEPVLDKETRKNLDEFLANYCKLYIEDNLKKGKENFYPYIKQFAITFSLFKRYIDQYGNEFTCEIASMYEDKDKELNEKSEPYLPIHNLVALEYMDFIEVKRIWITDMDTPPEEQTGTYKVNIEIKEKFHKFTEGAKPSMTFSYCSKKDKGKQAEVEPTNIEPSKASASQTPSTFKPQLKIEGKMLKLQVYERTTWLTVAEENSQICRLMIGLFSPDGSIDSQYNSTSQTIQRAFTHIQTTEYLNDPLYKSNNTTSAFMVGKIRNKVKDIYKNKKLKGIVSFEINEKTGHIKMKINMPKSGYKKESQI